MWAPEWYGTILGMGNKIEFELGCPATSGVCGLEKSTMIASWKDQESITVKMFTHEA